MIPNFDPSKMDPRVLAELTELVRSLPPTQIARMQQIMQKAMVGIDVRYEMEQFERELPAGFREKLMALSGGFGMPQGPVPSTPAPEPDVEILDEDGSTLEPAREMDVREARLTVLRAVAEGDMTPEEAERVLWPES